MEVAQTTFAFLNVRFHNVTGATVFQMPRVAFLELKDERRLVQEGYELLDEKRVLLATEIMPEFR